MLVRELSDRFEIVIFRRYDSCAAHHWLGNYRSKVARVPLQDPLKGHRVIPRSDDYASGYSVRDAWVVREFRWCLLEACPERGGFVPEGNEAVVSVRGAFE